MISLTWRPVGAVTIARASGLASGSLVNHHTTIAALVLFDTLCPLRTDTRSWSRTAARTSRWRVHTVRPKTSSA